MGTCQTCKHGTRDWAFQPFGPDEHVTFTTPGSHYRGFAVIGICNDCKARIESGDLVRFTYKGRQFEYAIEQEGCEV